MARLTYAVITAVRDEVDNIPRLAEAIHAQTQLPTEWIVVDNGSVDGSLEYLKELSEHISWMTVVSTPAPARRARGGPIADAVEAGIALLRSDPDVVFVIDADVSMPQSHCASLLREFAADPELGIASGSRREWAGRAWKPSLLTGTSVEAQCRAYRRRCLEGLLPLERSMGWDGIDVALANVNGWRTRTLRDLTFCHHRPMGGRDGSALRAWIREGEATHVLGYRPSYVVLRALHNARSERAALALILGHFMSILARKPKSRHRAARNYLREQQRLRHVRARAREVRASS